MTFYALSRGLKTKQWLFLHFLCWSVRLCMLSTTSVCNFQSMKSPVELSSLFLKLFCYITWFDQTRHWAPCERGLYFKSYCFFEIIAYRLQTTYFLFTFLQTLEKNVYGICTIVIIIFWDLMMFDQIFWSPQSKRSVIIDNRHGIYELPHKLPKDLRLRKLENICKILKPHRIMA